jgi:hypothetical protein
VWCNLSASERDALLALDAALKNLETHDAHLFTVDANERSITHHLAKYLELEIRKFPSLSELHVDAEYNRDGETPKILAKKCEQVAVVDTKAKTIFPDIIIHKRGSNDHNVLVVEAKKISVMQFDQISNSDEAVKKIVDLKWDQEKLVAYQEADLRYNVAVHVFIREGAASESDERRTHYVRRHRA